MIFNRPVKFKEALASHKVSLLMPRSITPAEVNEVKDEFKSRSVALAKVTNAEFLQRVDDVVGEIIEGNLTDNEARVKLKDVLQQISYRAPAGKLSQALEEVLAEQLGDDYALINGIMSANEDRIQMMANEMMLTPLPTVERHGLKIHIENPAGSRRSGTDKNGQPWTAIMPNAYGEIIGSMGADGDPVDVTIGDSPNDEVYVIDQLDPKTGKFDEHKCFIDFKDSSAARVAYLQAYPDGSGGRRINQMTQMTVKQFKNWLNTRQRHGIWPDNAGNGLVWRFDGSGAILPHT